MHKIKYSLRDYMLYSAKAESIMRGYEKVNKEGWLINGDGGGISSNNWIDMIAYHHWFNKDDIIKLFHKLGLCNEQIDWILHEEKKRKELYTKLNKGK